MKTQLIRFADVMEEAGFTVRELEDASARIGRAVEAFSRVRTHTGGTTMAVDTKQLSIPKAFWCGGQRFEVELPDRDPDGNLAGSSSMFGAVVRLFHAATPDSYPRKAIEQTLLHEMVHLALGVLNARDEHDEKFVDSFAHLLHQMLTMQEGEWPLPGDESTQGAE